MAADFQHPRQHRAYPRGLPVCRPELDDAYTGQVRVLVIADVT